MENVTAAQVKDALERVIASFRLYCMRMMSSFREYEDKESGGR